MAVDFSETDIVYIYGHFTRQINDLNKMKAMPKCPVNKNNINQEIKLCTSITDKIEQAYPNLKKLSIG